MKTKTVSSIIRVTTASIFSASIAFVINPVGRMSDIKGFYVLRFDDGNNKWPYSAHMNYEGIPGTIAPFEYPVISGVYAWILSLLTPGEDGSFTDRAPLNYYYLSIAFLIPFFIGCALFLLKIAGEKWAYVLLGCPAFLSAMFLNWDIICISFTLLSIYFFEKGRVTAGSLALAAAISSKFFPLLILPLVLIDYYRRSDVGIASNLLLKTTFFWCAINIPIAMFDFSGWFYFYEFSYERTIFGDGSIYQILREVSPNEQYLKLTYYLLNLLTVVSIYFLALFSKRTDNCVRLSFPIVALFVVFGKVSSVQFVVWLTPLVLLYLSHTKVFKFERAVLVVSSWQFTELFYHFGFYQNLKWRASQGLVGFSEETFLMFAIIRFIALFVFVSIILLNTMFRDRKFD